MQHNSTSASYPSVASADAALRHQYSTQQQQQQSHQPPSHSHHPLLPHSITSVPSHTSTSTSGGNPAPLPQPQAQLLPPRRGVNRSPYAVVPIPNSLPNSPMAIPLQQQQQQTKAFQYQGKQMMTNGGPNQQQHHYQLEDDADLELDSISLGAPHQSYSQHSRDMHDDTIPSSPTPFLQNESQHQQSAASSSSSSRSTHFNSPYLQMHTQHPHQQQQQQQHQQHQPHVTSSSRFIPQQHHHHGSDEAPLDSEEQPLFASSDVEDSVPSMPKSTLSSLTSQSLSTPEKQHSHTKQLSDQTPQSDIESSSAYSNYILSKKDDMHRAPVNSKLLQQSGVLSELTRFPSPDSHHHHHHHPSYPYSSPIGKKSTSSSLIASTSNIASHLTSYLHSNQTKKFPLNSPQQYHPHHPHPSQKPNFVVRSLQRLKVVGKHQISRVKRAILPVTGSATPGQHSNPLLAGSSGGGLSSSSSSSLSSSSSNTSSYDRMKFTLIRNWKEVPLAAREKVLFLISSLLGTGFFFILFEAFFRVITYNLTWNEEQIFTASYVIAYLISIIYQHALNRLMIFAAAPYCLSLCHTYAAYSVSLCLLTGIGAVLIRVAHINPRLIACITLPASCILNYYLLRVCVDSSAGGGGDRRDSVTSADMRGVALKEVKMHQLGSSPITSSSSSSKLLHPSSIPSSSSAIPVVVVRPFGSGSSLSGLDSSASPISSSSSSSLSSIHHHQQHQHHVNIMNLQAGGANMNLAR